MRNMRLPVILNEATCTITDTASMTNNPPTMASTISCLVVTATAPSAPPSESDPVSPMKTMAGGALYQRNPKPPPINHLERIIDETEQAEAQRNEQNDPDVDLAQIGPQQCRADGRNQNQEATHRRCALLFDDMPLRTIGTDRLSLALPFAQPADHRGTEYKCDEERRHHRAAGPEGDVAEDVQDADVADQMHENDGQHLRSASARPEHIQNHRHAPAER